MTQFAWNLLLALIWSIALDDMSPRGVFIGFIVGYLILSATWRLGFDWTGTGGAYSRKVMEVIGFILFFIRELVVANARMALYTITPLSKLKPGIVGIPLDEDLTDLEITSLAGVVSLTPGTLTLDVSEDRRTLYVHFMDASDVEAVRSKLYNEFEARIKRVLR